MATGVVGMKSRLIMQNMGYNILCFRWRVGSLTVDTSINWSPVAERRTKRMSTNDDSYSVLRVYGFPSQCARIPYSGPAEDNSLNTCLFPRILSSIIVLSLRISPGQPEACCLLVATRNDQDLRFSRPHPYRLCHLLSVEDKTLRIKILRLYYYPQRVTWWLSQFDRLHGETPAKRFLLVKCDRSKWERIFARRSELRVSWTCAVVCGQEEHQVTSIGPHLF